MAKDLAGSKQLMHVAGKPILEHTLDNLPHHIDSLVFVVGGPHEDAIRKHFSAGVHKHRTIAFAKQETPLGTAHAFWSAKDHVADRFLGLMGDEIIGRDTLERLASEKENAVLVKRVSNPERFGVIVADNDGYVDYVVEKPQEFVSDMAIAGGLLLDRDFLTAEIAPSARGEYETPDVMMHLIKNGKRFKVVETDEWLTVNDKAELERARKELE